MKCPSADWDRHAKDLDAAADAEMGAEWETFCRRTNDPKLAHIEKMLHERGIPSRRNGESCHAPILEVPAANLDAAWGMLGEIVDADEEGNPIRLDDIDDDDPMFYE